MAEAILFYDGVCGLCDRLVQLVLRRDRADRFRFAALQTELARQTLTRHGRDPDALDTLCLLLWPGTPQERLLTRSRAALELAARLPFPWRLLAALRVVPTAWLDRLYDWVARHRYRLFGKAEQCLLPTPEQRGRFVALP